MKNTINNNINNCFGHHVLLKPSKCSVTPTNMTPKLYKELIADHILSGVKKTLDGNIYKPNPHNVTSELITISYIDPETGQTVEPTILTEVFNQLLQNIKGNTYWRSSGTYQTSGIYTATNTASGTYSTAEGYDSTASANYSHAEGCQTTATGLSSHAEGESTTASGDLSHAEGDGTTASGDISHAEGNDTSAQGDNSHAEGYGTVASGDLSHAEGDTTLAYGANSHAEGIGSSELMTSFTISGGAGKTGYVSSLNHGLIEGSIIKYGNIYAMVTEVTNSTHFILDKTLSNEALANVNVYIITGVSYGANSHSEGKNTIASNEAEHACGKYNVSTPGQTLFSIGNGTSDSDRRNVFEVTQDGNIIGGSFSSGTSIQTINTADTAPVVTKSESIILLEQDSRIPPFLDLASFSMSPGQHITIFLTSTFSSLSVSLVFGYEAYIYTLGNVEYKLGPTSLLDPSEVYNITALYSKIDIIRISTHQWTITLY